MKSTLKILLCSVYIISHDIFASNLSGPRVYVVTPSPRPKLQIDEGRAAPFYYHNWLRKMDSPMNLTKTTTTSTTTTVKPKTPDLIFAEFESDTGDNMKKSLRKLLEKERTQSKISSTTTRTVPSKSFLTDPFPITQTTKKIVHESETQSDAFNNFYLNYPTPIYVPKITSSTPATTVSSTTTTTTPASQNLESVWHIIDSERQEQQPDQWEEISIDSPEKEKSVYDDDENMTKHKVNDPMDVNFALPGFGTNPGNDGENESRAIRNEANLRFPYINLKPFKVKPSLSNSEKNRNAFMNLDNLRDVKYPVRGEAQEISSQKQPIDRYNPAQPYLPSYGTKSKQSNSLSKSVKTASNLVPPPPPSPPKLTDNDFPAPVNYVPFPPFPPSTSDSASFDVSPPAIQRPMLSQSSSAAKPNSPAFDYQPPADAFDDGVSPDTTDFEDSPVMNLGYQYKPPSSLAFVPTLPPTTESKIPSGYSYNKPMVHRPEMHAKPLDNSGISYNYDKPVLAYQPSPTYEHPFADDDSRSPNHPLPSSYSQDNRPSYHHNSHYDDSEYPELVYNKPHDTEGSMDMVPPPLPNSDMKPDMDTLHSPTGDHGFPYDFPHDFKFNFDDHGYGHYHDHHTTTTTTTTEMPRVNRFSYYYLGKKLYYLPLYFSVYFIAYVGALIIKAVLRHKITYPNSWRPNDQTASFFSKRSLDDWDLSNEKLHEVTGKVTKALAIAAEKYLLNKNKTDR